MIGDGFTRFENPVSVSLVKQGVSLKPKLEAVSVSTNGSRFFVEPDFGFESETGFSFGIYVKQTVSIQPLSMDS